jgi:hypothetical protein
MIEWPIMYYRMSRESAGDNLIELGAERLRRQERTMQSLYDLVIGLVGASERLRESQREADSAQQYADAVYNVTNAFLTSELRDRGIDARAWQDFVRSRPDRPTQFRL